MHVIPTAGCNPFSVFFVWFLFWLCVLVCLFAVFALLFLPCCSWFVFLFVLLLGLFLDCVLVHNRHFCGVLQMDCPAGNMQFSICRDWTCVTTWRKPWRRRTEKNLWWNASLVKTSLSSCNDAGKLGCGLVGGRSPNDNKPLEMEGDVFNWHLSWLWCSLLHLCLSKLMNYLANHSTSC